MNQPPIFSSYSGGENRVTSTTLAVLQHVGIDLTERILAGALGDAGLGLVSFTDQPSGGGSGVPDGEIRGRFRYLIETKTRIKQIRTTKHREQIERHLARLDGTHGDERLVVVTPDAAQPELLHSLGDPRVQWCSFSDLAAAIDDVLGDPEEPASERQRFLLRQLLGFLAEEGVLGIADTLVVAARIAYPNYLATAAYVCQANRSFREVPYIGFYTEKAIQPEIATRLEYRPEVVFTNAALASLEERANDLDQHLARVMRFHLQRAGTNEGDRRGVMLLTDSSGEGTTVLQGPVPHQSKGAWTQGQRYTRLDWLTKARSTRDLDK